MIHLQNHISQNVLKNPSDSKKLFTDTVRKNLKIFQNGDFKLKYKVKFIGNDARKIINKKIDHVISSPLILMHLTTFEY